MDVRQSGRRTLSNSADAGRRLIGFASQSVARMVSVGGDTEDTAGPVPTGWRRDVPSELVGNEVSVRPLLPLWDAAKAKDLDPTELLHGVDRTREEMTDPRGRISWKDFAQFLSNLGRHLDDDDLVAAGEAAVNSPALRAVLFPGRLLYSPTEFYLWVFGPHGPATRLFVVQHGRMDEVGPGHVRFETHMNPGYVVSRENLLLLKGSLAGLSRLLGAGHAEVALEWLPDGARFDVTLAQRTSLFGILRRVFAAPFAAVVAARELTHVNEELYASYAELQAVEDRFDRLAQNAPVVIFRIRLRPERTLEYISPAIEDLLGYSTAEAYEDPDLLLRAVSEDDVGIALSYFSNADPGAAPLVMRQRHRDGHMIWTETRLVSVTDAAGEVDAIEGISADITQAKSAEAELLHHGTHDDLTGLANRERFHRAVASALTGAIDSKGTVAVLILDLDRFKVINDSLGHTTGDVLITAVAGRLSALGPPVSMVARFGGDEFAVLLERFEGRADALAIGEHIRQELRRPIEIGESTLHTSVSIGIAFASADGADQADDLFRHADAALSLAKDLGRDRCEVFDDRSRSRLRERLQFETSLRQALENDEFVLHYQPLFELATREMVGVEALIRWNHPVRGLVAAAEFVPFAEDTGLIVPMGEWVLDQVRAAQARLGGVRIAVNLSTRQLNDASAVDRILKVLRNADVDPTQLCLEITETALMADLDASLARLTALKDAGVELAIDDFGTGYSSLSYLQRFPIDSLKIDKSFVDGLGTESNDTQIVEAIISLARAMELTTVAEGIETSQQLAALSRLGCDYGQGYLLGRPMPAEDVLAARAQPVDSLDTTQIA